MFVRAWFWITRFIFIVKNTLSIWHFLYVTSSILARMFIIVPELWYFETFTQHRDIWWENRYSFIMTEVEANLQHSVFFPLIEIVRLMATTNFVACSLVTKEVFGHKNNETSRSIPTSPDYTESFELYIYHILLIWYWNISPESC